MNSWSRTVHGSAGGAGREISASAVSWLLFTSISYVEKRCLKTEEEPTEPGPPLFLLTFDKISRYSEHMDPSE
jgi:hypothetical protein